MRGQCGCWVTSHTARYTHLEELRELLERAAEVLRDVGAQCVRVARAALAPQRLQRRHAQRGQHAVQPVVVLWRGGDDLFWSCLYSGFVTWLSGIAIKLYL